MQLNENFELTVSIGDAPKAIRALRSYGLTSQTAEDIIANESIVAIYDHGLIPKFAISPYLIEIFGEQHINDAVSYSYLFMDEFGLDWDCFKAILNTLLRVFSAEEIIVNPEKLRFFISSFTDILFLKVIERLADNISEDNLSIELLSELSDSAIIDMATDPNDEDDSDYEED